MDVLGIDPVSAAVLLAELPNIAGVTPEGPAAFAGLPPREHRSGTSVHPPGRISRIGSEPCAGRSPWRHSAAGGATRR